MMHMLLKATGIWLIIVVGAILNGVFREKVLAGLVGSGLALPLSGALLSMLVFLITFASITFIGAQTAGAYLWVGLLWVVLTLTFELLLGHFMAGKPWREVLQVFNVKKGDLFLVVLVATALSPWLAARLRGLL